MIVSPSDALDFTEKWLEDTVKSLQDTAATGGAASDSSLHPLSVHNHAYLRLLRWDHDSDPFPEVNPINPGSLYLSACLDFPSCVVLFILKFSSAFIYRRCWWIRFDSRRCSRRLNSWFFSPLCCSLSTLQLGRPSQACQDWWRPSKTLLTSCLQTCIHRKHKDLFFFIFKATVAKFAFISFSSLPQALIILYVNKQRWTNMTEPEWI